MRLPPKTAGLLITLILPAAFGAAPATAPHADAAAIKLVDQLMALPSFRTDLNDTTRRDLLHKIAEAGDAGAAELVGRLAAIPDFANDPGGAINLSRVGLINDMGEIGDVAIPALQAAIARARTSQQRIDLTQALGSVRTPAGTKALLGLTKDRDDDIRTTAISGLIGRLDNKPEQGGDLELLSILTRIVPGEQSILIRTSLCWGVRAELTPWEPIKKPDPARVAVAVGFLHDRLKNDASADVRFVAACSLTEFGDNSGATELKKAAIALQGANAGASFTLEQMVPAIERISGRKFGPIPMSPMLSSDTRKVPALKAARQELIDRLAKWAKDDATF